MEIQAGDQAVAIEEETIMKKRVVCAALVSIMTMSLAPAPVEPHLHRLRQG